MTSSPDTKKVSVEIAIPVFNEQAALPRCIEKLLKETRKEEFRNYEIALTIVNNASTDGTKAIAEKLSRRYDSVRLMNVPRKGRGGALRFCWDRSVSDILAYMDVDLSADLSHLPELLETIAGSKADIAIGSRLAKGAKVVGRTLVRELMSQGYNTLITFFFGTHFTDAQCGFKALSKQAYRTLAPLLQNQNWFFDSEMLITASKLGMRIKEIPVNWRDDPSSTVKIARTAGEDFAGLWRLLVTQPWKKQKKL